MNPMTDGPTGGRPSTCVILQRKVLVHCRVLGVVTAFVFVLLMGTDGCYNSHKQQDSSNITHVDDVALESSARPRATRVHHRPVGRIKAGDPGHILALFATRAALAETPPQLWRLFASPAKPLLLSACISSRSARGPPRNDS